MNLAVELARRNVERGTGGPFGAAIFDRKTGRLVAPGVNLVTSANCSVAHAEMVAIMIAQKVEETFDLGSGERDFVLYTSTEPCAMCLGAVPWSGVRHLVCAARDGDARAVGFDEGTKAENWERALAERGITVARDVLREEAAEVLRFYIERGGKLYNSREG
ncbi:nucleoside deaminase [Rubrobacter indicoceani]|uniref:nucleoside deaminase n=1 Tax=Rubrobacter indicoceani TaxID=2051957 RepID=UPI000E5B8BA1|nr:nucleoside deaminase [Rubrobacter indicoceani]